MTSPKPAIESPWMLVPAAAIYAQSSRTEILEALNNESLRGYQRTTGGKWRIHRDDLDAWLRGQSAVSAPTDIVPSRRSA